MSPTETDTRPAEAEQSSEGAARYVGARMRRVEDPRFLTGQARYVDNIELPGCLHAAFVRSPLAHARIREIDVSGARELAGVVAVYTAADLAEDVGPITTDVHLEWVEVLSRTALASDKVRHVGEPVVLVVATSRYVAEDACDRVLVDYEELPGLLDPERALADASVLVHEQLGHNVLARLEETAGDVEGAFAAADHVFSKRFRSGRSAAAPLEGRAVMARFDAGSGRMTVWVSSQSQHLLRTLLAPILKLPERDLTVISPDVGGAFGLKCHVFSEDVVIPAAARRLGRPVKWIEDRYENLVAGVHSKDMICEMELAVASDGTFLGLRARYLSDSGAYGAGITNATVDCVNAATGLQSVYKVENLSYSVEAVVTNKCAIGAVRGVGWSPGQIYREALIDEAARGLGIDPVELRLKNCLGPEPQRTAFGAELDGGSYAAALELAAERIGYAELRERQAAERAAGRHLGVGFSVYLEPGGMGCAGSAANRMPVPYHDLASVTVEPDGSVVVTTGLHSHGQGHETTLAQVAADELGVTPEDVRVAFGDTDAAVWGSGTYASRSAVVGSGGIALAAQVLRKRLQACAAILLEADAEEIELRRGFASLRSDPTRSLPIAAVAGFAYFGGGAQPPDVQENGLTATRAYDPPETYGNGAVAVVVAVDAETGFVTIEDLVMVEDCGVMLNPLVVDGQVAGGIAQGIGVALLEEAAYGEDGQYLSGSLMDYLYPSTTEVPTLRIAHLETPSNATINGVKGMGESGTIGTPAAIVNAIADALAPFGVRIDRTPVTPSYLLGLIRDARASSAAA
ncbi:MAG TPA: xanthine dehydrogenase family protein molybdopterin-binding subunit [Conexibacter sp.]|nr:xanthine dehydrogenase family protein molybdopterin-binding subunit [Conexibacter sp.]